MSSSSESDASSSLEDSEGFEIDVAQWRQLRAALCHDASASPSLATSTSIPKTKTRYYARDPRELYAFNDDDDMLGEGGYGCVYRATLRTVPLRLGRVPIMGQAARAAALEDPDLRSAPSLVALKLMWKKVMSPQDVARAIREVEIMSRCQHEGICRLEGVFETPELVALSCELCEGGELFARLLAAKAFPERTAVPIFAQITRAVAYLHGAGIVHRDLKLENIMFSRPELDSAVKLVDFGFARYAASDEDLFTPCGTVEYIAPEIARHEGHAYQRQVDAWSLGVVLYVMLCGFPPFIAPKDSDLLRVIAQGHYTFPPRYWSHISEEAKSLVAALLEVDPRQRITPERALEHAWLKKYVDAAGVPYDGALSPASLAVGSPPAESQLRRSLLMAEHLLETKRDEDVVRLRSASESALFKRREAKRLHSPSEEVATPSNASRHKLSRSDEILPPTPSPKNTSFFSASMGGNPSSPPGPIDGQQLGSHNYRQHL